MDADLVSRRGGRAHDVGAAQTDVGARQQRAVQQRPDAVVLDDGRALDLREEAGSQRPLQRTAGVIGSEAEEEGAAQSMTGQQVEEARHAFERPAQRIDVDLQRQVAIAHADTLIEASRRSASPVTRVMRQSGMTVAPRLS